MPWLCTRQHISMGDLVKTTREICITFFKSFHDLQPNSCVRAMGLKAHRGRAQLTAHHLHDGSLMLHLWIPVWVCLAMFEVWTWVSLFPRPALPDPAKDLVKPVPGS